MELKIIENDVVMFGATYDEISLSNGVQMTSPDGMKFIVSTTDDGFQMNLLGKEAKEGDGDEN